MASYAFKIEVYANVSGRFKSSRIWEGVAGNVIPDVSTGTVRS